MSSVQERLQLKRTAVDKWSIREHLCLASAVSCSGDQNWMSVSRTLKMICGSNRPADWFSQKSCAVQFNEILENVETPKRKKRTASERDNQNQSAIVAETPTESIHRKLTQERINELKISLQKEQEEYTKLREEILSIQNDQITDEELHEMWLQIEREKEQKIVEQQKYALWLKEREERKLELQRAWRPGVFTTAAAAASTTTTSAGTVQQQGSSGIKQTIPTILKSDDMDIDETISPVAKQQQIQQQQQQQKQQQGTSPLLTSLLKSQSSNSSSTQSPASTSTSVRIAAPTITNLLTGGSISTPTTITSIQSQNLPPSQFNLIQPLSGLSILNIGSQQQHHHHHQSQHQIPQSPSQAAPTLSSLLETSKNNAISIKDSTSSSNITTTKTTEEILENINKKNELSEIEPMDMEKDNNDDNHSNSSNKELMDVFDNLIDENINELAEILTNNNAIIPEILDQDLENVELEEDDDNVSQPDGNDDDEYFNIEKELNKQQTEVLIKNNNDNENSKNISDLIECNKINDDLNKYDEITTKTDVIQTDNIIPPKSNTKIQDSSGIERNSVNDENTNERDNDNKTFQNSENESNIRNSDNNNKDDIAESENSVQFVETKDDDESQESIVEIKDELINKIENENQEIDANNIIDSGNSSKLINNNDNTSFNYVADNVKHHTTDDLSEDSGDVTFQELAHEISEKIKAAAADDDHESNKSSEDILEITEQQLQIIHSIESSDDNKKSSTTLNYDDSQDAIIQEDESIIAKTVIDEKTGEELLLNKQKSSVSESSDIIIIPEDESNDKKDDNMIDNDDNNKMNIVKDEDDNIKMNLEIKQEIIQNEDILTKAVDDDDDVDDTKSIQTDSKTNLCKDEKLIPEQIKNVIESSTITIIDTDDDSMHLESTALKDDKTIVSSLSSTLVTSITTTTTTTTAATTSTKTSSSSSTKLSNSKRDYSRKKSDASDSVSSSSISTTLKKSDESMEESKQQVQQNLTVRKLRDSNRDRSESPFIDDDTLNDSATAVSITRTRRRYSSTPVIDSIPSSPASSITIDAAAAAAAISSGDHKAWKKSILIAYNRLVNHKNASMFLKLFNNNNDDQVSLKLKRICLRPIDLQMIKKNIENGTIRTTLEFQRDIMLLCQNAMMLHNKHSTHFIAAKEFMKEAVAISEQLIEKENLMACKKEKDDKTIISQQQSIQNVSGSTNSANTSNTSVGLISSSSFSSSGVKSRPTASRKSQRLP